MKFIRVDAYELAYVRGMVKAPKRRRLENGGDVVMEDGEKEEGEEEEEREEGEDDDEGGKKKRFPKMEDLLPSLATAEEPEGTKEGGRGGEWGDPEEWEPDPIALNNLRKRKSHHNPILIGEVKLPALRKAADESGLRPKLARGVLSCSGIKLYKPSEGGGGGGGGGQKRWEVEGPVCDEFYAVRDLLLKKYQVV